MQIQERYACSSCGGQVTVEHGDTRERVCCGKKMQAVSPMNVCTETLTAEHARMDSAQAPCDDGRAGN